MIISSTYEIISPALIPYVQYILFNQSKSKGSINTSYSNTNVCLGILNKSNLERQPQGGFINKYSSGINSYLSGFYLRPHHFTTEAPLDEICIDFSPLGFHSFFNYHPEDYIIDDILLETFGHQAKDFFSRVFEFENLNTRGRWIESFLLRHLKEFDHSFVTACMHAMHSCESQCVRDITTTLNCSERKLQRTMKAYFGISPKQYLKILRFRKIMHQIQTKDTGYKLSDLAYGFNFYDESHMHKDIYYFTGKSPTSLARDIRSIDDKVFVST
ncbi:AraC family transcriptional regulator [Portibacter marinus]|uniref:AraC family transcriptional regulator n=1 Tax=Portibacter marinus TaxID=2898660 RepID=UPI001F26DA65|nr:helix-turn-helix domain-containing protein [Portibacter marinus]